MNAAKKKITDIVGENYVYAAGLNYFGIEFYDYSEYTLAEVCKEKNISLETVLEELGQVGGKTDQDCLKLMSYPVDLIIEYLKHAHYIFIKRRLPYIAKLIDNYTTKNPEFYQISTDLKFIFPLFVEDFIHHIYQEEDTLFSYIMVLEKALRKQYNPSELYFMMESHSIQEFAMEHDAHDDEMQGIRKITNDYKLGNKAPLHLRVIYSELQSLESSLVSHARIENEVLFPKALALEKSVKNVIKGKVSLN